MAITGASLTPMGHMMAIVYSSCRRRSRGESTSALVSISSVCGGCLVVIFSLVRSILRSARIDGGIALVANDVCP